MNSEIEKAGYKPLDMRRVKVRVEFPVLGMG